MTTTKTYLTSTLTALAVIFSCPGASAQSRPVGGPGSPSATTTITRPMEHSRQLYARRDEEGSGGSFESIRGYQCPQCDYSEKLVNCRSDPMYLVPTGQAVGDGALRPWVGPKLHRAC